MPENEINIRIWNNKNKKWYEPISIMFDKECKIWKITAIIEGEDSLSSKWYDFHEPDLSNIAIVGNINFNINLIPRY